MNIIIIGISSDIGTALAHDFNLRKHTIIGTYLSKSNKLLELKKKGIKLIKCDVSKEKSISSALPKLKNFKWDAIIFSTGTQEPIGKFAKIKNFKNWEKSIYINFISNLFILHSLLPSKKINKKKFNSVLFFAGGGTNNATSNYSAYTISKIALIKICELLDYEIQNVKFSILGPGWVKTKIHNATINNKKMSGQNYFKTIDMIKSNKCYPIEKVVKCCNWIINSPKKLVGGRNFSAVNDPWEEKKINKILKNQNNFKLRRFGNNIFNK